MHPEIRQRGPGACPKCGMALEPVAPSTSHAIEYVCPMHPQLVLATPVVLWGGWPFFVRGWVSVVNRSLNMFTLIALGVGTAYVYSVVATFAPGLFPSSFRSHGGEIGLYYETAAIITVLVLL